ncbi:MAG TPA: sterol desaturase family protein [Myxococcota bacterium]|nr:sterol desaturase family protein [Myxococcota bacterium]
MEAWPPTGVSSPPRARLRRFATGALALFLASLALAAVACLHFPATLTTPELRAIYPMPLVRETIRGTILAAGAIGALALLLDRGRRLGALGMVLALAATLAGGADVPVSTPVAPSRHLGLDWFVLDLFVLALVFVPLERAFARRREQHVLRHGWQTDLTHFGVSHLLVQLSVFLTLQPAALLLRFVAPGVHVVVAAQPAALQLVEALVLADLAAYAAHRAFHAVPALWRFHAIHHSSPQLDWIAGSRLHLVDVVVTRGIAFLPLHLLGFAEGPLQAYLVWVSFQAVWIHANLRFEHPWLERLLVTPRFHHWHHAAHAEAIDRNFAVHVPWIDRIFGTLHLPTGDASVRWPTRYGIAGDPVPDGWLAQLAWPFARERRRPEA